MDTKDLVKLALKILSCSQKELAIRLGVSPSQITKWKKNEYMSFDMMTKLRDLLSLGDQDPSFILWAGSLQEAKKWEKLIHFLAETAESDAETGYITYPLIDDLDRLCWNTFYILRKMGVEIPEKYPKELNKKLIDNEETMDLIEYNPYSSLIYKIYLSFNDVYGFYVAYINDLIEDGKEMHLSILNIEPCLMELAACKIEVDDGFAPNFLEFRLKVMEDYEEWINLLKESAFRAGTPLRAELLDIVYGSHDELGHEAEAMNLGIKSSQLHPDIYMNELLCGMRTIHQVLPAIMKKLGIYDEFKLDTSKFTIK